MKNEHELQRGVEEGNASNDIDSRAYEIVFDAVKKEPGYTLKAGFADRVMELAARQASGSATAEFIWMGIGVFLLFIAMIVALANITFTADFGFLSAMSSYAGLFVFGAIFIAMLHFIDRRFIRRVA